MSKEVACLLLGIYDILTDKIYLYALAKDKVSYLRSDDNGFTWVYIQTLEYLTVTKFI